MRALLFSILLLFWSCFGDDTDDYGDNFFGDYIMPLAATTYSNDPQQCLTNIEFNAYGHDPFYKIALYRQYTVRCDSLNDTCTGYTAVDCLFSSIIIGFKGTTNPKQFFQGGGLNYTEEVPVGGGNVSKQFFDAFNDIWIKGGMKDDVLTLKNRLHGFRLYFVGHSVGAAMASIAATTAVSTGIMTGNNIFLMTFGQPRTGNKNYADSFNAMLQGYAYIKSLRVVHNRDIVPHLPPLNASTYYHHLHEIWYPNDMGINDTNTECSDYDGEDPACSNSLPAETLNFDDHNYYCGRDIIDFGMKGCIFNNISSAARKKSTNMKHLKEKLFEIKSRQAFIGPNVRAPLCPDFRFL